MIKRIAEIARYAEANERAADSLRSAVLDLRDAIQHLLGDCDEDLLIECGDNAEKTQRLQGEIRALRIRLMSKAAYQRNYAAELRKDLAKA